MSLEDFVQCIGTELVTLSKVIWARDLLPCLITVHIDIEAPVPFDQECVMLYAWLCIRFTPSLLLLATTLIMRLHNRAALCDYFLLTGIGQYDTPDVVTFFLQLMV
jgi:hypothetical protein